MKFGTRSTLALAAATLASAQNSTATCATGVHMIVARGSNEDPGPGRMGIIADGVLEAIPGSDIESIDYPASFDDYGESVDDGVEAMGTALRNYSKKCPDGKVVLMGYSQGGQVTVNTLCGGPGEDEDLIFEFDSNPPFDAAIVNSSVIAVVVFGDPSFTLAAPWKAGNSSEFTKEGLFARKNITACLPYAPKIRSWCDEGDRYCALGNVSTVHGGYFVKYFDDAVDFVIDRYEASESEEPTSSAAPSGTASVSPSSTGAPSETETSSPSETDEPSGTGSPSPSGTGAVGVSAGSMAVVSWGMMGLAAVVGLMSL